MGLPTGKGSKSGNLVRSKLLSNNGASITFALLIFLVCAIVSAVVLVAGTTAAGRIKGIAETDQRYYAVTSAANLLKDLLDDHSVSQVTTSSGTFYVDGPMNLIKATDLKKPDPQTLTVYLAKACLDSSTPSDSVITISAGGTEVTANITAYKDTGDVVFILNNGGYKMEMQFSADKTSDHPPLEEDEFTSSNEIRWHLSRMITSFDKKELDKSSGS